MGSQSWTRLSDQQFTMGRSDSRVSRIPHLGKLYLTEFLGQTLFLILFCRWPKLLIGITIWVLPVGTQSAIIQVLVFRSPYSLFSLSDLNGLNPVESLSVSYGESRRGALMKWTTCWVGGDRCHPWALFYTWDNCSLQGELLEWCCAGLREGQCGQSTAFLLPF